LQSLAVGIFILSASVASAATIVSTFGPGQTYGAADLTVDSTFSVAVSFTSTATVQFGSVEVGAYFDYIGQPPHDFYISLDADSSGAPGAVLESFAFGPSSFPWLPPNITSTILTGTSLLNPTLYAGTQYWIVFSTSQTFPGYGLDENGLSPEQYGVDDFTGGSWSYVSYAPTPAFEVDSLNSTPEPAAGVLLGAGLLALAAMRKHLWAHWA